MGDFNYKEYLKNNPLLQEEVKEEKLITESQEEVQEYVETSGDPVGDDLKKLKAFVDKSGSKAKAAFKNFLDSIELGSMQKAMASEELEVNEEEVTEEASSKMKVSELKAKIKEDIISLLQEAEEDVDVDVEDEVEADVDVDVKDKVDVDAEGDDIEIEKKAVKAKVEVGLSPEEEIVQDSLKAAMDAAESLGNDILVDQIGNTITYFTRKVVVGDRTD